MPPHEPHEPTHAPRSLLDAQPLVAPTAETAETAESNPCRRLYGAGPQSTTCAACAHLVVRQYAKRYYKCDLRVETRGAATDHRLRWAACARFVRADDATLSARTPARLSARESRANIAAALASLRADDARRDARRDAQR